jgi:phosphotransferase system HPr (HPr) family protein
LTDGAQVRVKAAIVNQRGLHARASAKFVETASKFRSEIAALTSLIAARFHEDS